MVGPVLAMLLVAVMSAGTWAVISSNRDSHKAIETALTNSDLTKTLSSKRITSLQLQISHLEAQALRNERRIGVLSAEVRTENAQLRRLHVHPLERTP